MRKLQRICWETRENPVSDTILLSLTGDVCFLLFNLDSNGDIVHVSPSVQMVWSERQISVTKRWK